MSLYATNIAEEAVAAALKALRDESDAVGEELNPQPERIAGAVSTLITRWRRLDRSSPYRRPAVEEAAALVGGLVGNGLADLALEQAELAALVARQEVAERLREARRRIQLSVREAAERAQVATSYFSELEGGRSGLPTESVCERLEATLPLELVQVVRDARTQIGNARDVRKARRAWRPSAPAGAEPRLAAAVAALARDRHLLALVEHVDQLAPGAKSAVVRLARDLAEAGLLASPRP